MGIPVSNIIGAPFSGWLLGIEGHGFKGWQWMYILEGIPTLALGFAALWCLPDNPRKAHFLTEREKDMVMARLAAEDRPQVHGFGEMMKDWRVWALIIPDFAIVFGIYSLGFWMPQMVKAMGYSIMETSLIVMIPYSASIADPVGHRRLLATAPASGRCISSFPRWSAPPVFWSRRWPAATTG